MIDRRTLLCAGALAPLSALPAFAQALTDQDRADIARVEAYVNSVTTIKAEFTQIAPTGRQSKGTIYISRPGRLRVEIKPPVDMTIVATPVWLVVTEAKFKEPQYLPLNSTPASILVRARIAFSGDIAVVAVKRENIWLNLTVVEAKNRNQGRIILTFNTRPALQMIGWTVIDPQGQATQVSFDSLQAGLSLDPKIFLPPLGARTGQEDNMRGR